MRWLFLWFLSTPAWANLFFVMPNTPVLDPGELVLDLAVTHGHYFIIRRDEDRTYIPDLRLQAQFHRRLGLSVEMFGIQRSESRHGDILFDLNESAYGAGDVVLGSWVEIWKPGKTLKSVKGFFKVKIPSANVNEFFGSDETDFFMGLTSHLQASRWSLGSMIRFDVIGRDQGQWDYITVGQRPEFRVTQKVRVLAEAWYRYRSTNETSLLSLGMAYELKPGFRITLLAGDGNYSGFEVNPDSRLNRQFSLQLKWKWTSGRFEKWLGH